LSQAIYLRSNADAIQYAYEVTENPEASGLDADQIALQEAYMKQW